VRERESISITNARTVVLCVAASKASRT